MRKAAEAGHGSFTMISALHEVNEKMDRLFRKIEQPQVTDIRVEWPAGTAPEAYPATIPDLYIGEPILVRSRLGAAPRAGDLLTVSGNSPSGAWGAELAMGDADGSAGIAALWARSRIEDLLDRERHGEDVRQAVVETAIKHHLVSKYTSLVAVDKTPAGPQGEGLDQEQVPSLLPYGQSTNKIFGFAQTATGAPVWRQNGMMLIVLSSILLTLLLAGRRREPAAR